MKVSLNWLKEYLDINLPPAKVGEILTDIGLEVEGEEEIQSIKGGLEGVVVGHVIECGQHPNADRLSLTKVDVGAGTPLQIVCGAPNVAKGQKVLVATVGTVLHPLGSEEPLVLKKGKIRGETSEGMICAEDELGLGTDHNGILVLPEGTPVGLSAKEYLNIETDYVYEIGLTPNRSDATNHLGVARDLSAALQINYGGKGELCLPDVSAFQVDHTDLTLDVRVENTEACPRYAGVSIQGVTIKESPDWLKKRLEAVDVRPINNIVDITNFVLHELGQPLHAFDLDKITGGKVIVKTLPEGSKFTTLDEVERSLYASDLMICDGASKGMCIGGVFGGINSGVTGQTANIFLEAAHFNPQYIRRSSMRHNLRTDAAKVFEKGSDPNIAVYALKRATLLIKELAGGTIASEIVDIYPNPIQPVQITVGFDYINRLIGVSISKAEVEKILRAMDMEIISSGETEITVGVPTNKSDVLRPADLVEEILRIYGFNKVPIPANIGTAITIGKKPDPAAIRNKVADFLSANGFNEMMAVSLSQSKYYEGEHAIAGKEELVFINNTSNVHLDIMRPDMLYSGLEAVLHNQNRKTADLKLFEFGKTYRYQEGQIKESSHLSLFITGSRYPESWLHTETADSDFYTLKAYVQNILASLGFSGYQEERIQNTVFGLGLRWHRGPATLVEFGQVNMQLTQAMDIRNPVFYACFEWDTMFKALSKHKVTYTELSKFPTVRRDLALIIDHSVTFKEIEAIGKKVGKNLIKEINLFDVYENKDQLGAGKRSYAVSFLFEDPLKTLRDKEVDKVINKLIHLYETQLGAVIRR